MPLEPAQAAFVLSFDSSSRRWNKKSVSSGLSVAGFFERRELIRSDPLCLKGGLSPSSHRAHWHFSPRSFLWRSPRYPCGHGSSIPHGETSHPNEDNRKQKRFCLRQSSR